jgi:hypothetical protein
MLTESKDRPVTRSKAQAVIVEPTPVAEIQANWTAIAQAAASLSNTPSIDIDAPDNSDLRSNSEKIPVNSEGQPMMFDPKSETWFPININLPSQNMPAPAAPAIPEDEKRKQLIMIFGIALLVLLIALYFISRKK